MTNCGYFQEYDNINFKNISHLLKLNRIPLFLIYVSVPEIEVTEIKVPEIIQIKSNIKNPSNSLSCNHCGRIYKQIRWLDDHIKSKHSNN